jgi:CRISPR-associated protein Cst2
MKEGFIMQDNQPKTKVLTHIVGTFLIQAEGAFLNGAGLGQGEYRNVTVPKTLSDFKDKVPYVSSQAWKRWLRNTFQEENPDELPAVLKVLSKNAKGNPDKIGTDMDPVVYAEDDIFGYMRAQKGQGRTATADNGGLLTEVDDDEEGTDEPQSTTATAQPKTARVQSVMRPSPFSASILMSLRKTGWEGTDEGYVHLQEGTPLPYSTRFYNTQLQGIFGLNYARLGVFRNEGDRIELDPELVTKYKEKLRKEEDRNIYVLKENKRRNRATKILKSLAVLRKPAKEAQFATDIAPKVIIAAGLTSGNLIFNDLLEDAKDGPILKTEMLLEIISDYADRLVTPVFVGIRKGYLNAENEKKVRELRGVTIVTPLQAIEQLTETLPE